MMSEQESTRKLRDESEILDEIFRAKIINDIEVGQNVTRKQDSKKRFDLLHDKTRKYLRQLLLKEYEQENVIEMENRMSTLSVYRKIVDKKAQVYKDGVIRAYLNDQGEKDEKNQLRLEKLIDLLNWNQKMKRINKFVESAQVCEGYLLPYMDKASKKWKIALRPLFPHFYDVIEDCDNREEKRVLIFSYFTDFNELSDGNRRDEIIADEPDDAGEVDGDGKRQKRYIWWSDSYHFTTDGAGRAIPEESPKGFKNPIGEIPSETFSRAQDGNYWAEGGDDMVDGSILINLLLTDLYFIAKFQGMGIFYLFGKGVPTRTKIGPSDAIIIDTGKDNDAPKPEIGFATSNPPLNDHMSMVEQQMAFLLSTNNLEPGTVQGKLDATKPASGIQDMISRSENMDDIEDQRETYRDGEKGLLRKAIKFINIYDKLGLLHPNFEAAAGMNPDADILIKYKDAAVFQTEIEKLDIIAKRRELLLDSIVDGMLRDDPDLDPVKAKAKLKQIFEDKKTLMDLTMDGFLPAGEEDGDQGKKPGDKNENEEDEDKDKDDED